MRLCEAAIWCKEEDGGEAAPGGQDEELPEPYSAGVWAPAEKSHAACSAQQLQVQTA